MKNETKDEAENPALKQPAGSGQLSCPNCTSTRVKSNTVEHTCQYCGTMWARQFPLTTVKTK